MQYIRLPLKGSYNTRDLGGYPTYDGNATRFNQFLRSDEVGYLSEEDIMFLKEYGVKTVIDLRTKDELEQIPNPFENEPLIKFHHISLISQKMIQEMTEKFNTVSMDINYINTLELEKRSIAKVLKAIHESEEGCILFHCSAGKDRTGLIAMLLLGIAGVDHQDIITNYEPSFANISHNPRVKKMIMRDVPSMMLSNYTFMQKTLKHIDYKYGSIKDYVKSLGFIHSEINQIRNRLVNR